MHAIDARVQRSGRQTATKRRAVLTPRNRDRRDTPPTDRLVRSCTGASMSAAATRATAALKRATDCSRANSPRAAVRGLQVDDRYRPSRDPGLPQARQQLTVTRRRGTATDDDTPRPRRSKGLGQGVSGFTDRWAQQRRRPGQFASQLGSELT